jgi:tRNA (guanine-N7-)-methyltransferase
MSSRTPTLYQPLPAFCFPDTAARLYPNTPQQPWVLEVGFGDGRFWSGVQQTQLYTNSELAQLDTTGGVEQQTVSSFNYLGVEISGVSLQKALARLNTANVENALLCRVNAEWMVQHVVPVRGLARVFVNFPDPWPKSRHEEARLLRRSFFELLSTRLADGGALWLTTDHPGYYEFALEQAALSGLYQIVETEAPAAALQTKYAMRWQGQGLHIHHVRFIKQGESQLTFAPIEVFEMPHAVLSGVIPQQPLEKRVLRAGDQTVILLERYFSEARVGNGNILVLARIEEPYLTQEVLIAVRLRAAGDIVVGVEPFGGPLITAGVKAAVGAVTDWCADQGLTVVRRSY